MSVYDEEKIPEILKNSKTIAVVGISDKPDRDSFRVANYLVSAGYNVIPVNPMLKSWQGRIAYPNLLEIPRTITVDVVDIFRRSEAVRPVVEEAVRIAPRVIWMQEGVVNIEAADLAKRNNMLVVMDRCMMKEHHRLKNHL
ncbi:CoA-binding protein [Thermoplasmatales archaeon AK]|nr:CoA-binding protein [Thermoplasmatales archaeon AK]